MYVYTHIYFNIAYYLLPICLLPIALSLLRIAYCLLPICICLCPCNGPGPGPYSCPCTGAAGPGGTAGGPGGLARRALPMGEGMGPSPANSMA